MAPAKPGALAVAVPYCAMAVVVTADLAAGPQVGLLPVLSLGSALAPVALGPARTILTGVLAVALSLVLATFDGIWFSTRAAVALVTIAGVTAAGVVASATRQGREKELVNDRRRCAGKGAGGGPDVGRGAGCVRESAYDAADLVTIADHVERSLGHQAPGGRFVTAIMVELPADSTEMRCFYQPSRHGARALLAGPDPDAALDLFYDDVLRHVGGHHQMTRLPCSSCGSERDGPAALTGRPCRQPGVSVAAEAAVNCLHWRPSARRLSRQLPTGSREQT